MTEVSYRVATFCRLVQSVRLTVILKNFMHIDSMVDREVLIMWNLIRIGFIKQKLLIYQCRMHVSLH